MKHGLIAAVLCLIPTLGWGHDTWIQVDSPILRVGDTSHINLMLGNHGNGHRDFKLASKISPEGWTLSVHGPTSPPVDLKPRLVDLGYAPNEGFWAGRFVSTEPGLHVVAHTLDKLHRTTRAIKSSKSYLLVSDSLDQLAPNRHDHTKALGHPIELIPLDDPIRDVRPGAPLRVQLLYQGRPLEKARVSFIPRGATLAEGFDETFERWTDANGKATYTPAEGNWLLVVVHHAAPEQKGEGYDKTAYTATLTIQVPSISRASLSVDRAVGTSN